HIMDLMRVFVGDARSCFAAALQGGKLATKADVRQGGEGMGPVLGDHIQAVYGFDGGVQGAFGTHRSRIAATASKRFGLEICGSKGVIRLTTGSLPTAYFLDDPSWFSGRGKVTWQEITSAGLGKPEPLKDGGLGLGNQWIAKDLIEAIE